MKRKYFTYFLAVRRSDKLLLLEWPVKKKHGENSMKLKIVFRANLVVTQQIAIIVAQMICAQWKHLPSHFVHENSSIKTPKLLCFVRKAYT